MPLKTKSPQENQRYKIWSSSHYTITVLHLLNPLQTRLRIIGLYFSIKIPPSKTGHHSKSSSTNSHRSTTIIA
ncbi:hypothetical protein PGB90_008360 [Kerria lacca]